MPSALIIGLLIFTSYTLIAVSTCSIAKAKYAPTLVSGALFMVANFFLIQHVADARTVAEFIGYLIGGLSGDVTGIYISKKLNIV